MRPPGGRPDDVAVVISAETEDSVKYEWRAWVSLDESLRRVAQEWARAHSVPPQAVGLEADSGEELNLDATPGALGWKPGKGDVRVTAYPLDEEFMERSEEDDPFPEALQVQAGEAAAAKKKDAPQGAEPATAGAAASTTGAASQAPQALSSSKRPAPAGAAAAQPPAAPKRAKTAAAGASATPGPPRPRSPSGVSPGAAASATPGPPQPLGAAAAAPPTQKKGSKAPAAAKASPDAGAVPDGDAPVVFLQTNPKRAGTGSHERYDKYKAAKTPKEALMLGACKGDLQHDFKKGFMKRAC